MLTDALILDAVRTPIGKLGGALSGVRPDDLAATALKGLLDRHPALDPSAIEEVYFGDANGAGEDNRNVARMAVLLAELPVSISGATVNRLCGSGLEAVSDASRAVAVGEADLLIAGGVESMTRAPWVLLKPSRAFPTTHEQVWNSALGWRMVNPKMPKEWTVALGEGAEILADEFAISREEQDMFAFASHMRAADAWERGAFAAEAIGVPGVDLARDECIRDDTTVERLATLKPAFREGGSVTAGNSSPMNDGSAALLLASPDGAERAGVEPMARIVSRATSGVEPQRYGIGPVTAALTALQRADLKWDDIDSVELNEAFAAQSLACLRGWPDLDPMKVNPLGGAIAIGHPLGASGARILTTLVHHLKATGGRFGVASMCIGVGQGIAMVVENLRR
ncbi:MAG TPA: acetyl-CoA C-acyltransferase [Acidimicrobiales bacterium]|nr:acetyl-CoA C-acyltransferase [Acidimicrobiales bacterium]